MLGNVGPENMLQNNNFYQSGTTKINFGCPMKPAGSCQGKTLCINIKHDDYLFVLYIKINFEYPNTLCRELSAWRPWIQTSMNIITVVYVENNFGCGIKHAERCRDENYDYKTL